MNETITRLPLTGKWKSEDENGTVIGWYRTIAILFKAIRAAIRNDAEVTITIKHGTEEADAWAKMPPATHRRII